MLYKITAVIFAALVVLCFENVAHAMIECKSNSNTGSKCDSYQNGFIDHLIITNARVNIDYIPGKPLQLNRLTISGNSTLVLNLKNPENIQDGDFLVLFIVSDTINANSVYVEIENLSDFFFPEIETRDDQLGVSISQSDNYNQSEDKRRLTDKPVIARQGWWDYISLAKRMNPNSKALDILNGAPNESSWGNAIPKIFSAFQFAALDIASAVQRMVSNNFMAARSGDVSAEAFGISTSGGTAIGGRADMLSGAAGVYYANAKLDYFDGAATADILGARLGPKFSKGKFAVSLNTGYQVARFSENLNSFGLESTDSMDVESIVAGLVAEYKIPVFGLSLIPTLRYNWQMSRITEYKESLFFDSNNARLDSSVADTGLGVEYKSCVVNRCSLFGAYALAGYDFNINDNVINYGASAKFSVDSDFAWVGFSYSGEQWRGKTSHIGSARLWLVF